MKNLEKILQFLLAVDANSIDLLQKLYDEQCYRRSLMMANGDNSSSPSMIKSFPSMRRLVEKFHGQIEKLGESIWAECDSYESKHSTKRYPLDIDDDGLDNRSEGHDDHDGDHDGDLDEESPENHGENYHLNPKCRINYDQKYGKHFIADDDILPGEIVLEERPFFTTFYQNYRRKYCHNCNRLLIIEDDKDMDGDNRMPRLYVECTGCDELIYCSPKCRRNHWQQYHRYECGIHGLLAGPGDLFSYGNIFKYYALFGFQMIDDCHQESMKNMLNTNHSMDMINDFINNSNTKYRPIDQWSLDDRKQSCSLIQTMIHHRNHRTALRDSFATFMSWILIHIFVRQKILSPHVLGNLAEFSRIANNMSKDLLRMQTNAFCWSNGPIDMTADESESNESNLKLTNSNMVANCLQLLGTYFNHDCRPNMYWYYDVDSDSNDGSNVAKINFVANRLIHRGEQLTISYGSDYSRQSLVERQTQLHSNYCFNCCCDVCQFQCCYNDDGIGNDSRFRIFKCFHCQNGPLIMINDHKSICLSCQNQFTDHDYRKLSKQMKNFHRKFSKLFNQLFNDDNPSNFLMKSLRYLIRNSSTNNNTKLIEKNLIKIRQIYETYHELSFKGDLQSTYMSILMFIIMVNFENYDNYDDHNGHDDLIDQIFSTIQTFSTHLKPQLMSMNYQIFVLQLFEIFLKLFETKYHESIESINHMFIPIDHLRLYENINQSMLRIMNNDLLKNGWLFPETFKFLNQNNDESIADGKSFDVKLTMTAKEKYYRNLYYNCQKKLLAIRNFDGI